jgi:adenosylmethionine-8-amino-7-oxononanoate aminotransferase
MTGGMQDFWTTPGGARPPRIDRAEGLYVWDTAGRRYLDVTSGPVAVNLGHGNARVLAAMQAQAQRACFAYPTSFESEANIRLSEMLAAQAGAGLDRAFFVNSGSEAVEKCMQFARMHAMAVGQVNRWKVIARYPSYHGSTLGALALSGDLAAGVMQPYLRESPRVPAPLSYRLPPGHDGDGFARQCLAELEDTIQREGPDTVLAFIMEPVIGLSGGAVSAPDFYYGEVRRICDRHGVLLIYDEIISGAGRTGRFLAAHHWPEARPDLVVLAKGIGSGYYPLGAFLAPASMVEVVASRGGFHYGHTHKGSPLGCAVGLAVLEETVDRGLIARAEATGAYLRQRLSALMPEIPILGDVRGRGLLNAAEIVADQATKAMLPRDVDVIGDLKTIALGNGLLIYGRRSQGGRYGDWLMMTPPLIAEPADIDMVVDGVAASLREYTARLVRQGLLR